MQVNLGETGLPPDRKERGKGDRADLAAHVKTGGHPLRKVGADAVLFEHNFQQGMVLGHGPRVLWHHDGVAGHSGGIVDDHA